MFNKNKQPNELRPAEKSPKGKPEEKNRNTQGNKDSKKQKADMQSEGGTPN